MSVPRYAALECVFTAEGGSGVLSGLGILQVVSRESPITTPRAHNALRYIVDGLGDGTQYTALKYLAHLITPRGGPAPLPAARPGPAEEDRSYKYLQSLFDVCSDVKAQKEYRSLTLLAGMVQEIASERTPRAPTTGAARPTTTFSGLAFEGALVAHAMQGDLRNYPAIQCAVEAHKPAAPRKFTGRAFEDIMVKHALGGDLRQYAALRCAVEAGKPTTIIPPGASAVASVLFKAVLGEDLRAYKGLRCLAAAMSAPRVQPAATPEPRITKPDGLVDVPRRQLDSSEGRRKPPSRPPSQGGSIVGVIANDPSFPPRPPNVLRPQPPAELRPYAPDGRAGSTPYTFRQRPMGQGLATIFAHTMREASRTVWAPNETSPFFGIQALHAAAMAIRKEKPFTLIQLPVSTWTVTIRQRVNTVLPQLTSEKLSVAHRRKRLSTAQRIERQLHTLQGEVHTLRDANKVRQAQRKDEEIRAMERSGSPQKSRKGTSAIKLPQLTPSKQREVDPMPSARSIGSAGEIMNATLTSLNDFMNGQAAVKPTNADDALKSRRAFFRNLALRNPPSQPVAAYKGKRFGAGQTQ